MSWWSRIKERASRAWTSVKTTVSTWCREAINWSKRHPIATGFIAGGIIASGAGAVAVAIGTVTLVAVGVVAVIAVAGGAITGLVAHNAALTDDYEREMARADRAEANLNVAVHARQQAVADRDRQAENAINMQEQRDNLQEELNNARLEHQEQQEEAIQVVGNVAQIAEHQAVEPQVQERPPPQNAHVMLQQQNPQQQNPAPEEDAGMRRRRAPQFEVNGGPRP